ncbi:MAG TPA: ribosome small subunit-dependent GTPase A [Blastocatellia bacterium]|nr:ribosome small subunit-dependent GTPase A [Blastocatellia bacterium]
MHDLKTLGWNAHFDKEFEPYRNEGYRTGRVALEYQGLYRIFTESGEMLAEVTGRMRFQAGGREDFPAVGDWVVIAPLENQKKALIHAILPRTSKFSRKAAGQGADEQVVATNVDVIFLVQGLDKDYNLRRIERYLALALESGAHPVIILNKADLADDLEARVREVESISQGLPVHAISAKREEGLEALKQYLGQGVTAAFLGSSGVGKSTLINRLLGRERQKVSEVRQSDDRGRHTTRHRELIVLPEGGLLIDTPGMRELQLLDVDEGLADTFADIETIARDCYFSNCRHEREPDCAVKAAIEEGILDPARLENYKKMQSEIEYLESRNDFKTRMERKERERKFGKLAKEIKKRKR